MLHEWWKRAWCEHRFWPTQPENWIWRADLKVILQCLKCGARTTVPGHKIADDHAWEAYIDMKNEVLSQPMCASERLARKRNG